MSKLFFSTSIFRNTVLIIFILSIVIFTFLPTLKNDFVFWDDDVHLYENITVRSLDSEHVKTIFTETVNKLYIPLTILSFAVEHHYFGHNPFVYHFDNLILHLCVVVFIYWLGIRLGLSMAGSGIAALLFGIHPMHVESVAWVTERKDVLYSFFYMLALLSYSRYLNFTKSTPSMQNKKLVRFLVLTTLFGVLSMLAKPMALSLPLILLLLDWFHGRKVDRSAIVEKIPLVLFIGAITWLSYVAHVRVPGKGILESALIFSWTFVFYIKQFALPLVLVPVYQLPKPVGFINPEYFLSVIFIGIFIIAVIRFRKHRWFIFSVAWYVFSVFFLLRYDEIKDTNIVADRFMYLPSLGFCFLFGYGFQCICDKVHRLRILIGVILVSLMSLLSVHTYKQSQIWQNSIILWKHQLKFYPNEPVALNNLAAALREQDEYKIAERIYKKSKEIQENGIAVGFSNEALLNIQKVEYVLSLYKKAIAVRPNFIDSHYNLGNLYSDIGLIPEAVEAYKAALKLDYAYKDVHFSLGNLYQMVGDHEQAVYAYGQTIALNPEDEDVYVEVISAYIKALKKDRRNVLYQQAWSKAMDQFTHLIAGKTPRAATFFNLGYLYGGIGDLTRAESAYQMVLDINPNHSNAIYNLGNIYRDQGRLSDALVMYQRAVKADPRQSDAFLSMGTIYQRQGKQEKAKESFQGAVRANDQNARAYYNLGYIEEQDGSFQKAIELYKKSIDLDSSNPLVYYNLGNTYARFGKNSNAISSYLKATEVDNNYVDAWINLSILSFKIGDFDNAVKYCDEAVLLGYKAPAGYLNALEPHRKQ